MLKGLHISKLNSLWKVKTWLSRDFADFNDIFWGNSRELTECKRWMYPVPWWIVNVCRVPSYNRVFTVSRLAVGASTSGFGLLGVWAAEVLLTWDLSWPKWVWTNLAHWRVGWSVWDTKMEAISIGYGGPRIWSSRSKSANVKKGCRFRLQWCWNISLLHCFVFLVVLNLFMHLVIVPFSVNSFRFEL